MLILLDNNDNFDTYKEPFFKVQKYRFTWKDVDKDLIINFLTNPPKTNDYKDVYVLNTIIKGIMRNIIKHDLTEQYISQIPNNRYIFRILPPTMKEKSYMTFLKYNITNFDKLLKYDIIINQKYAYHYLITGNIYDYMQFIVVMCEYSDTIITKDIYDLLDFSTYKNNFKILANILVSNQYYHFLNDTYEEHVDALYKRASLTSINKQTLNTLIWLFDDIYIQDKLKSLVVYKSL